MLAKNQIIKLKITDLSYQAMGVGHFQGLTIFVNNALPGETVQAKLLKVKKKYAFAKIEKILTESPDRVKVPLRQWLQTGLASLAHMTYDRQLSFKRQQVVNLLAKAHLAEQIQVGQTLASPHATRYRNKAQVPVRKVGGQLEIGFFRRRSHDLVPMTNFLTTAPGIDQVLVKVRDILRTYKIPPYDEIHNRGQVRYLDVRRSQATGEIMVILVCRQRTFPQLEAVVHRISRLPKVVSVVLNHNPAKTNVILGPRDYLLWGKPQIVDQIGPLKFKISPQSFFQINSEQTPRLYQLAIAKADLHKNDTVIDAYAGIGTIGLSVAKRVKKVLGVESVAPAVKDAKANAKLNGIANADYVCGRAEAVMPKWAEDGLQTDAIFVDPPRKGLTPEFIDAAVKTQPKKIVYISCNPATQIRDLQLFMKQGYSFNQIDPVDMFPQTPHVEAVTVLKRSGRQPK